jgi:putative peptidoglycan lipid II flippase
MHVPSRTGVAKAALLITAGGLASRILGLVREQLAAGYFGAGDDVAAFQIADNVQTLLFDLVISGMLQAALVPVLVEFSGIEDRHNLRRISGTIATVALISVGLATMLGWLFTDRVVEVMTSLGAGEQNRSAQTVAITEHLVRIVLPGVLFLAIGTVFSAVLYSLGRPSGPAVALAARNLVVVIAILALADRVGVESMAYGVLIGGALVAVIQLPWLIRLDALPRPNLQILDPAVRQIGRLYVPVFLGLIVSTVQVVVDRNLAWRAEADALGAMRYATTLVQSVLGLVAAAVSLAALPVLATHFSNRDEEAFDRTLVQAVRLVTVLIVPAVFGLAALSRPVVGLLFEHGETGASEAESIATVLVAYLPGTLFAAYDQILIYMFYSRRSTWIPVLIGVMSVGFYFVFAGLLADRYGAAGLAIANSAQFVSHALVLGLIARDRIRRIWSQFSGLLAIALVAAVTCAAIAYGAYHLVDAVSAGVVREFGSVLTPVALAGAVYLAILAKSQIPELELIRNRLSGRLPLRQDRVV